MSNQLRDHSPLVSIVIASWNNAGTLSRCLAALASQTFAEFEVILVDNSSVDGSAQNLEQKWPRLNLHVERLARNYGFAAANNIGASRARGQWLALLNADAFPEPDWLECLIDAAQKHPHFVCFASCLVQADAPTLLDGAGDVYHVSGLSWRRLHGRPIADADNKSQEVFGACAAAALYRRDVFLEIGGFDETFFSYHEDVDLGFRLRLKGLQCLYVPHAVVYHVGAASSADDLDARIYWGHRNLVWTYVKNMPSPLFWLCLPVHLAMSVVCLMIFASRGHGRTILRAKVDAVRGFGQVLRSRRKIQRTRRVGSSEILRAMDRSFYQLLRRAYGARLIQTPRLRNLHPIGAAPPGSSEDSPIGSTHECHPLTPDNN